MSVAAGRRGKPFQRKSNPMQDVIRERKGGRPKWNEMSKVGSCDTRNRSTARSTPRRASWFRAGIHVAVGRDPSQAVPLSGTYVGNSEDELGMKVEVSVKCESDACNRQ